MRRPTPSKPFSLARRRVVRRAELWRIRRRSTLERRITFTLVKLVHRCNGKQTARRSRISEARQILDEWVNDKLRLEAGLDDSDDEHIVQANVRSVKEACNLSFDDEEQMDYLRDPKDLLTFQDPSVYYETHDETDLVKDILHGSSFAKIRIGTFSFLSRADLRSKDVLTRQQLAAIEQSKPKSVNIQTKIEERHRQVKENHERMQKEREAKRKQEQLRKEAEAQARLLVLKVKFDFVWERFDVFRSFSRRNANER